MKFHLQLFPPTFSSCVIVLLVLFLPAALTAYFLHSAIWLTAVPLGIIAAIPLGIIALAVIAAAIRHKGRKVTPEQFADELERHLLGTEKRWDWDDITSVVIADERLERIRWELPRFDSFSSEKDKDELRGIIAALRSGEVPEIVPPTHLTYRNS
jgi:hypothetical protein